MYLVLQYIKCIAKFKQLNEIGTSHSLYHCFLFYFLEFRKAFNPVQYWFIKIQFYLNKFISFSILFTLKTELYEQALEF